MALNLNTASRRELRNVGLSEKQINRTKTFLRDNAVFQSKLEWKRECNIPDIKYEAVRGAVLASKAGLEKPREVQTRTYRRQNNMTNPNVDVGHIIAHSNGGANHPSNYIPMNKHYNRKLGNLHDGVIFAHLPEDRLREAVKVSRLQRDYKGTFADAKRLAAEASTKKSELPLYKEGFRGGFEQTDGAVADDELLLCDGDYCERLIQEWKEHYPEN